MSLYNKEQNERQKAEAEVTRLQGLLATAVASEHATKQALADAGANQTQVVQSVEARATAAESNVAELQREVARLTADGNRLAFLVKNPDIAGYADILPASTDTASLERAAATIRAAHETEIGRMRDHLTGGKASSGRQTPRVGNSAMSAAQIDTYLREAPHGEFERRLAEVTGRA